MYNPQSPAALVAGMTLLNQPIQVSAQLDALFATLRGGQAPEKFTREFLKDIGFKSSNHHAFIPLLKGLGFLTPEGAPTQRYRDLLDATKWRRVIAEAVREAYSDIFVIKAKPTKSDRGLIAGKYRSTYNMSDVTADRAARTFLALLDLADEDALYGQPKKKAEKADFEESDLTGKEKPPSPEPPPSLQLPSPIGLHYNIQIHLPATKEVEVYNAIFKSMREHIID